MWQVRKLKHAIVSALTPMKCWSVMSFGTDPVSAAYYDVDIEYFPILHT